MQRTVVLALALVFGSACSGTKSAPAPTPSDPSPPPPTQGSGSSLTADECTAAGGQVVGDIGDGAIHRPDYRCPTSGAPPIGHVTSEPGQPTAIEGAVCCR